MPLPSKKVIPVFLACLIASGILIYAVHYQAPKKSQTHILGNVISSNSTDIPVSDETWKNTLARLEPTVVSAIQNSGTTSQAAPENLNTTQQIARDLLSNFMTAKQGGGTLSSDLQDELAKQTIFDSQYSQTSGSVQDYTQANIKISSDNSPQALITYANAAALAILSNVPKNHTDTELSVLNQAVTDNNPDELSGMDPIITSYQNTLTALLKIPTPKDALPMQLALTNDYNHMISVDKRLRNFFTDPASGLYALKDYESETKTLAQDFQSFSSYFANKGIAFNSNDPAEQFINGL